LDVLQEALVEKTRLKNGRKAQPTAGILDSQSVTSTLVSSESKGFDAGKKIKGIKRHIIVDTLGLVLAIVIQSASVQDRDGAGEVIRQMQQIYRQVTLLFADGGYRGKLIAWVKSMFKIRLKIVKRHEKHTFQVLPKRWVVERTFAWIDAHRRNAKNYERFNDTSIAMVQVASIRIMLNRF
jgi:transposase